MEKELTKIETLCVTGAQNYPYANSTGAINVPIYQTATFAHPELGKSTGFDYSRVKNPTRDFLEKTIASLDHAKHGFAFSCGMAAISAFTQTLDYGAHIVCSQDLYGGTERLFNKIDAKSGLTATYLDTSDLEAVEKAIKPETKVLFVETPGNPLMTITDLRAASEIAHKHNLIFAVDNTFLSPYFQQPLSFGADVVIQSGTKFLCGHNDTLAGFITTNDDELAEKIFLVQKSVGAILSPFDSFMALRGIKTLSVRMDRQQENAIKIAEFLKTSKKVTKVLYPGLPECKGYEINKKQATGSGSMLSFYVDSVETVKRILKNVKIIHFAESLGGVESLITYPTTQTHAEVPENERLERGVTDKLLRISVGIENAEDLIQDLQQAIGL